MSAIKKLSNSPQQKHYETTLIKMVNSRSGDEINRSIEQFTKLYIKNMVSIRCKMYVKSELDGLGLRHARLDLGEIDIVGNISDKQREQLKIGLLKAGLELMEDKKGVLVEKIKSVIIEMVHYADEFPRVKTSNYISKKLGYNYTYLANIFSEVKGITIQQFIIQHKIEKVKELLMYDELTESEIAFNLHYSSVAHLSNQFKRITGLTPSFFKSLKEKKRIGLEDVENCKF